jgi:hypothetical protein
MSPIASSSDGTFSRLAPIFAILHSIDGFSFQLQQVSDPATFCRRRCGELSRIKASAQQKLSTGCFVVWVRSD